MSGGYTKWAVAVALGAGIPQLPPLLQAPARAVAKVLAAYTALGEDHVTPSGGPCYGDIVISFNNVEQLHTILEQVGTVLCFLCVLCGIFGCAGGFVLGRWSLRCVQVGGVQPVDRGNRALEAEGIIVHRGRG